MVVNRKISFKIAEKSIYLTAIVISVLTLMSIFGNHYLLELSTHFRLQYAWLSVICIIGLSAFRAWKFVLLMALCGIFNIAQIIPYYYAVERKPNNLPETNLLVMLANVQGNNKNYSELVQAVKSVNPDILVLQEVTSAWWENIQVLSVNYPYFKSAPRAGGSGLAIFSRYPIESADILTLDLSTHPALFCKINFEGRLLSVLTLHPPTPMRSDKFVYRNGQFAQVASIIKTTPEPKLIVGDLNTTIWSPYFTDLIRDSGLRDARLGKGLYPSWNAVLPPFLRIPIDHCLVSEEIEVENIGTGNYTGSDHLPLIINLKIEKQDTEAVRQSN